ncbi:MAG: hypothetical protein ABIB71_01780 [Candidatus Woesearchaeota archaeon]
MLRKIIVLLLVVMLLFVAGCASNAEDYKSEEEAQEAIVDVGEDVSDISDTLESINEDLG